MRISVTATSNHCGDAVYKQFKDNTYLRQTKLILIFEFKSTAYTCPQKFTTAEQCIESCWPN